MARSFVLLAATVCDWHGRLLLSVTQDGHSPRLVSGWALVSLGARLSGRAGRRHGVWSVPVLVFDRGVGRPDLLLPRRAVRGRRDQGWRTRNWCSMQSSPTLSNQLIQAAAAPYRLRSSKGFMIGPPVTKHAIAGVRREFGFGHKATIPDRERVLASFPATQPAVPGPTRDIPYRNVSFPPSRTANGSARAELSPPIRGPPRGQASSAWHGPIGPAPRWHLGSGSGALARSGARARGLPSALGTSWPARAGIL
jgi:hypothetical protein